MTKVFEVLKIFIRLFLTDNKFRWWSLVFLICFTCWVYLEIIKPNILDIVIQPLFFYIGWKAAKISN